MNADKQTRIRSSISLQGNPSPMWCEINRQQVEKYLVEEKGYHRNEIQVDAPIQVEINGDVYRSTVDLVVQIDDCPLMPSNALQDHWVPGTGDRQRSTVVWGFAGAAGCGF